MSRSLGNRLPAKFLTALAEEGLFPRLDIVVPLVSVDEAGRPHPALVSYGELLALRADLIRLVLSAGSKTTANLRRRRHATLVFADPDVGAHYVKTSAREVRGRETGSLALFELEVEEVLEDVPTGEEAERGVRIASALRFAPPPGPEDATFQRTRRLLREPS